MKASYRWLQDYAKTSLTPERLADKFRLTSSEVEEIIDWAQRFDGLVVGKVEEVSQHPNADRLRIAQVKVGRERRTIVCGAPNLEVGQTVIVAKPGTTIYPIKGEPITILESSIRGQVSQGMLCGAEEIGLPIAGNGILLLDDSAASGSSVAAALGLDDQVLDLEITPNRPDLQSYLGLAREISAFEKKAFTEPPIASLEGPEGSADQRLGIEIEDSSRCFRYCALCLEGITVGPSPLWLQTRLILSGIKPINNVVDVTNYCMLEFGQPLHAFDLDTLPGKNIRVRSAKGHEKIIVLDGTTRQLAVGDIVIADHLDQPIAIAGIMGGLESAISEKTSRIVIESATFLGPQIRRTSRRLGLRSEASGRFEKGLDPEMTVTVLKRAVYLLQEISRAKVSSPLVDAYPQRGKIERPRIHLSFVKIQQIAGINISAAECKSILQRLGFQIPSLTKSSFEAIPPSWRKDVTIPEDLVEELIRIWGFERLPNTLPTGAVKAPQPNSAFVSKQRIRRALAAAGLHECVHLSLTSGALIQQAGLSLEESIRLPYPLSSEIEYLIPSHLVSLLANLAGVNNRETELGLFEIGKVFTAPQAEKETLSLLLRGAAPANELYRRAKAVCELLSASLKLAKPSFTVTADQAPYQEGSLLEIRIGESTIGTLGLIDSPTVERLKIRTARHLAYLDIDLAALLGLAEINRPYLPPAVYPTIERDLTLLVGEELPFERIAEVIAANLNTELTLSWSVAAIFTGKPLPDGQKSVTLHFIYNSAERTLEDQEATGDQQRLAAICRTELSAHITE